MRLSNIAAIPISLPPLSTQQEIVAELERQLAAGTGELAELLGERCGGR